MLKDKSRCLRKELKDNECPSDVKKTQWWKDKDNVVFETGI